MVVIHTEASIASRSFPFLGGRVLLVVLLLVLFQYCSEPTDGKETAGHEDQEPYEYEEVVPVTLVGVVPERRVCEQCDDKADDHTYDSHPPRESSPLKRVAVVAGLLGRRVGLVGLGQHAGLRVVLVVFVLLVGLVVVGRAASDALGLCESVVPRLRFVFVALLSGTRQSCGGFDIVDQGLVGFGLFDEQTLHLGIVLGLESLGCFDCSGQFGINVCS